MDTQKIKVQRDLSRSCKLTFRSCLLLSLLFLVPKQTLPPLFLVPEQMPLRGAVVHKLSQGVCGECVFLDASLHKQVLFAVGGLSSALCMV